MFINKNSVINEKQIIASNRAKRFNLQIYRYKHEFELI